MPDRAVVDEVPCAWCGGDGYVTGSMPCPECTPTPRAVVALSEDRQWLVTLDVAGDASEWTVRRKHLDDYVPAHFAFRMDTGQGADEVLAAFLSGEEASDA